MNTALALAAILAALCSVCFAALIRRVAPRIGLIDQPDGHRKIHERPIPMGGGLAVYLALATVLAVVLIVPNPWNLRLMDDWPDVVAFSLACTGIVALGLVDDRFCLRGRYKLLGQVICVLTLMSCGMVIQKIGLFGYGFELGLLAVPFTMCWLLGAINAINLLDGIDGLATTLGIILSVTMGALGFMTGHPAVGAVALVFAASLAGFLPYNLPPARMYLGDAGSMLIGLMVGAMAIRASLKGPGTFLMAAPLAILTLPAFDSAAAIIRRKLTGRSIYATDRGHLHHQLLDNLGSNTKVLLYVIVACVVTSGAALGSVAFHNDLIAVASIVGVVSVFIAAGLFGGAELNLLVSRARGVGLSMLHPTKGRPRTHQSQVRLQGSRQWDLLWATVTESAEKLSLAKVRLDLNLPAMREGYNATWDSGHNSEMEDLWSIDLPLVLADKTVGRLSVMGLRNGDPTHQNILQLLDMLEPFERKLLDISQKQLVATEVVG